MREILFRGKVKGRDWVYGSLVHRTMFYGDPCDDYVIVEEGEFDYDYYTDYEVIPETVGQFTGLTDKNGTKIFKGDIVKHYCEHRADGIISIGVVFWDEKRCMFLRTSTAGNETPQIWAGCEYEVIGNIHDNPELLEV